MMATVVLCVFFDANVDSSGILLEFLTLEYWIPTQHCSRIYSDNNTFLKQQTFAGTKYQKIYKNCSTREIKCI